ncbi:MAG: aldo/keto reductase [Proteobacteria bacterium]|nr:aldo/keto reductase [Pseudomonadota bacterium]
MKFVSFSDGEQVPALGMGTWAMGESRALREQEIRSLQRGIELGMSLIDTAEMYGDGAAETLVGKAIAGRREQVFLVSKVYPHHASRQGTIAACERSLTRLATDCIDLYLLHWRGNVPFGETIAAFERLQRDGKIRHWGASNLDPADMAELVATPGGDRVATDQVLYNLSRRGIEWDLLPWCGERKIPLMAYSPIEQARLLDEPRLQKLAAQIGQPAAQLALAWVLSRRNVIAIPKAAQGAHVDENYGALACPLGDDVLQALDAIFPPPRRAKPLEML